MKFFIAIITLLRLFISVEDARSNCHAATVLLNDNYDFKETATQTYNTRYNWKGYSKLKIALKFCTKALCSTRGTLYTSALKAKYG